MHIHQPGAWVVGLEGEGEPASRGQHRDVAPEGVAPLEAGHVRGAEEILGRARGHAVWGAAEHDKVMTLWDRLSALVEGYH